MAWLIDALRQPVVELGQALVASAALALAVRLRGKRKRDGRRLDGLEAELRAPSESSSNSPQLPL